MVKEKVDSCLPCQTATTGKAERLEPRKMTTPPSTLWKELGMDFLGPLPSGEDLIVVHTVDSQKLKLSHPLLLDPPS